MNGIYNLKRENEDEVIGTQSVERTKTSSCNCFALTVATVAVATMHTYIICKTLKCYRCNLIDSAATINYSSNETCNSINSKRNVLNFACTFFSSFISGSAVRWAKRMHLKLEQKLKHHWMLLLLLLYNTINGYLRCNRLTLPIKIDSLCANRCIHFSANFLSDLHRFYLHIPYSLSTLHRSANG